MIDFDSKLSRIFLRNGLLLTFPPLIICAVLAGLLPKSFSMENFWKDIPAWLGIGENASRVLVFSFPLILCFGKKDKTQDIGWFVYIAGVCLYLASYLMQIFFPESAWSKSAFGFTATAWTTLAFFLGIDLVCKDSLLPIRS